MKTRVIVAVVLGALLLSAGAAFAQVYGGSGGPGSEANPYLRLKAGWFQPSDSDLDGDIALGLEYVVPAQQAYLGVDRLHATGTDTESTTWSLMGGVYRTAKSGTYPVYYGAGVGIARETLEQVGLPDDTRTRFAWEAGVGLQIGRKGFAEIHYRDGGSDANRGPVLCVGVSY